MTIQSDPGQGAFAITPSDSTNFTVNARGIYVGVVGDITLVTEKGETVTFTSAVAGTIIPVRCSRVNSTGTAATNLVGLY